MLLCFLDLLMEKRRLSRSQAKEAMEAIFSTEDPHQIAAFLAILRYRGESPAEVAGMVDAMEEKSICVDVPYPVLDIVGTGGDRAQTVNISTGSALLAASLGIPIAKHGNRSVSSLCGSADVIEALGLKVALSPDEVRRYLDEVGFAFMFAQEYHPFLQKIRSVRKGLKLPTVFNILGPLLNPARAEYALIGTANLAAVELMSKVLTERRQTKRAIVFHGSGLDELSPLGPAKGYMIEGGSRTPLSLDPAEFGFAPCSLSDLQGGDAKLNAAILMKAFAGEHSAVADALAFNTGAALWIYGKASTLSEGVELARKGLNEKKALHLVTEMRSL